MEVKNILEQMAEFQGIAYDEVLTKVFYLAQVTIGDIVKNIYGNQKSGSKSRGHVPPAYSQADLLQWVTQQKNYTAIMNEYTLSGWAKDYAPSIDRLDEYVGYNFDNIRLVTWKENKERAYNDRRAGVGKPGEACIAVSKYRLDGSYVCTYVSMREACRENDIGFQNMSNLCKENSNRKSLKGHMYNISDGTSVNIAPIKNARRKSDQPVKSTDNKSGVEEYYKSVKEASKTTGVKIPSIMRVLFGSRDSAGGYLWEYTDISYIPLNYKMEN